MRAASRPLFVTAAILLLSALAVHADKKPTVTFWLYFEDAEGHMVGDPGMNVFLVGPTRRQLGNTDPEGEFAIAKALIDRNRDSALLFCRPERPQCVAVLLERFDTGYDEYNLRVPPEETVDRFKVHVTQ